MITRPKEVTKAVKYLEKKLADVSIRTYRRKYPRAKTLGNPTWAWFAEVKTSSSHYFFHRHLDDINSTVLRDAHVSSGGLGDWTVKLGEFTDAGELVKN